MPKIHPAIIADMINKGLALDYPHSDIGPDGLLKSRKEIIVNKENVILVPENNTSNIDSSKKKSRKKNALRELLPEEKETK